MKGLAWYDKVIFFFNYLFAAALLLGYLLPYIPPQTFALISVLSLGVPLLIIANLIFLFYWILRLKKQLLLSLIILLLGFNHVTSVFEISGDDKEDVADDLLVMSYNVRQFNWYGWDKQKNVPRKISEFIKKHDPDIITMQEYYKGELTIAERYQYKYIKQKNESAEFGLAILSKYPIINTKNLDFQTASNNNGILADIVIDNDTLRIISVHFQSFSMKPDLQKLEEEHSKRVFLGMGRTFVKQQEQMELVMEHIKNSPHKVILMGDFNNTAYSYIYRELTSEGLDDAFKEDGFGFGRTFDFDYFPLRIDYIMVDEELETTSFETMEVHYSDHFPIKASIRLN